MADFQRGMREGPECVEIVPRETAIVSLSGEAIPVQFSGSILHEKGKKMGTVAFFQDLREIKALEIRQGARFEQPALRDKIHRGAGDPCTAEGVERVLRALIHQIDRREVCCDLRARHAPQAIVDLIGEQLGGLGKKVEIDQPVGEPAQHFGFGRGGLLAGRGRTRRRCRGCRGW